MSDINVFALCFMIATTIVFAVTHCGAIVISVFGIVTFMFLSIVEREERH